MNLLGWVILIFNYCAKLKLVKKINTNLTVSEEIGQVIL